MENLPQDSRGRAMARKIGWGKCFPQPLLHHHRWEFHRRRSHHHPAARNHTHHRSCPRDLAFRPTHHPTWSSDGCGRAAAGPPTMTSESRRRPPRLPDCHAQRAHTHTLTHTHTHTKPQRETVAPEATRDTQHVWLFCVRVFECCVCDSCLCVCVCARLHGSSASFFLRQASRRCL